MDKMVYLAEQQQIDALREKCENAKKRIWIASPYIGALKDVQRIIGGKWLLPSVDCRVLTDADFGFIRKDTFDEFKSNQVDIRSLDSLHAKIYIIDDWCLITSANLTGTAFFCKDGHTFKKKFKAQPYISGKLDKYDALCENYLSFAKLYENVTGRNPQMVADGFSLLQEVDYLFNYLYHDHPKTPSHGIKVPKSLSDIQKEKAISTYFKDMCNHYSHDPQHWRLERTRIIQKLLDKKHIKNLSWDDVKNVVFCLHCLSSYPINRTKFLNPNNNDIEDIKDCWCQLLHTGKIDSLKIKYVTDRLNNFGLSSIYELIGWFMPDKYPLMNENSHCGMRFFGYNVD